MVNQSTPFVANNKIEFEEKVEDGDYAYTQASLENLTVECMTFICLCLQYDEHTRGTIEALLKHRYIILACEE